MGTYSGLMSIPLSDEQCHDLRARRIALGLTQQDLAERVGCSNRTILRLENAQWAVSPDMLTEICDVLGMTWDITIKVTLLPAPKRPRKRAASAPAKKRKGKRS